MAAADAHFAISTPNDYSFDTHSDHIKFFCRRRANICEINLLTEDSFLCSLCLPLSIRLRLSHCSRRSGKKLLNLIFKRFNRHPGMEIFLRRARWNSIRGGEPSLDCAAPLIILWLGYRECLQFKYCWRPNNRFVGVMLLRGKIMLILIN